MKPPSAAVFIMLLEALIEVMADMLEHIRADLDGVSNHIFREQAPRPRPGQIRRCSAKGAAGHGAGQ